MRPISLAVENFGPYVERAFVDFEALGEFFLICGKTGSGKSSLFDAIAYALYGEAPGARRGLESALVSDFAAPGSVPTVEFVFSLSGVRYKVWRRAPYEKPKRKEGITRVPPDAEFSVWREGSWETIASGVSDCSAKAKDLVGLTANDFSKIILLPQGEFQQFLQMDSNDRGAVLEKLFPVDLYDRVAQIAKRDVDAAKARLAAVEEELAAVGRDLGDDAEARSGALEEEIAEAEAAERAAFDAVTSGERELERAKAEAARFARRAAVRERLEVLEAEAEAMGDRERRLAAARAASGVSPAAEAYARASAAASSRAGRLAGLEKVIGELEAQAAGRERARGEAASLADSIDAERQKLFALRSALEAWEKRKAALDLEARAAGELDARDRRLAEAQAAVEEISARISALEFPLEEESAATVEAEAARTALARAKSLMEASSRYVRKRAELDGLRVKRDGAVRDAEREGKAERLALEKLERLEREAAKGAAATLAKVLEPGQPCPVCGSTRHPAPAHLELDFASGPDLADLEKARAERAETIALSVAAGKELAHLEEKIAENSGILADIVAEMTALDDSDVLKEAEVLAGNASALAEKIGAELRLREETFERCTSALESFAGKRKKRAALEKEAIPARASLEQARANRAKAELELAGVSAQVAELSRSAGSGDPQSSYNETLSRIEAMENRRSAILGEVAAAEERLAQARAGREALASEHEASALSLEKDGDSLRIALAERGFLGVDETGLLAALERVRAAALPQSKLREEEAAVAAYRDFLARTRAEAAALAAEGAAPGGGAPDLGGIEATLTAARSSLSAARNRTDELRLASARLKEAISRRDGLASKRDRLGSENATLLHFASLIRGDIPPRRLPLKNYVLAAYFREVINRASMHLATMSSGRYYLKPDEGTAGGRGRIGLGLRIVDSWTGQDRLSGTLSGGEKFLTSLSLAFGLADCIRERRGGVSLDAVFVDEGFGSLDEEALDRAVDVLDRIRGSRVIGIVSHVTGLRSRIPARIEVEKSESGSRLSPAFSPAVE